MFIKRTEDEGLNLMNRFTIRIALLFATLLYTQQSIEKERYNSLAFKGPKPSYTVYQLAIKGHQKLAHKLKKKHLLTIIDFSLPSTQKRLWILNLKENKIIEHSLVSHGRNTGEKLAKSFSNIPNSRQSSLGFYLTGKTYYGKHGFSLYLHGMEKGFNDKALKRNIVIHGADYVSFKFIKTYGRLGRSYGCPALPMEKHKAIIRTIADKSILFIYYPEKNYLKHSKLIR